MEHREWIVRNEEVRRRAEIERELASRADQRVQWRTGARETEVNLNGWCKGGLRQQWNDGEGWATMRKRSERVESPGTYETE